MNVKDFLPKYPNINQTEYDVLNPYESDFYEALFHKKEFYENKLERLDEFPSGRGVLTKYQRTIVRYISNHTPYDRLLLTHFMGSGKTCSAVGAIEQIKQETKNFTGALILAKGKNLLKNFLRELVHTCTTGQYIPEKFEKLTELEKTHRINKKTAFYELKTFGSFATELMKKSDADIVSTYSNRIMVIDEAHNLRIQSGKKLKETKKTYKQFHRFLHLVQNCKVLFLAGTPMKDGPEEIASLANLMLPMDNQLPTDEEFINEYMIEKADGYIVKDEKKEELKNRLKGYVSFLREAESTIPKKFIGQENYKGLKHLIVAPNTMSEHQTKGYQNAFEVDNKEGGVFINSRGASLFVYPDGSYGKKGFEKYIERKHLGYKMKDELVKALKGSTDTETLEKIGKHSATYVQVIKKILATNGNCFVYSSLVKGSGAILFSLILELVGFQKASGSETGKKLRYALLTDEVITGTAIDRIVQKFNRKENSHGEYIKVLIGTKATSEGFSFKNVIFEGILTPHWNYSETAQALARGIRINSHKDLLDEKDNVEVEIMQVVSLPKFDAKRKEIFSIDLYNWKIAEDKDISINSILRLLMETAFDCALNYLRNKVDNSDTNHDGERVCNYTVCQYECDGIDMTEVEDGISPADLDYTTYQLYYANPKTPLVLRKIEQLLRITNKADITSIVKNLQGQFTEEEIRASLYSLQEEYDTEEFDYRDFFRFYSKTPIKQIMNRVEEMYRDHFRLDLDDIKKQFPENTEFEVISALQTIINDSINIKNRYGFLCYLKEQDNAYFLVNSLTARPDFYTEYYTRFPNVIEKRTFVDVLDIIHKASIPKTIKKLCSELPKKQFVRLIKTLPVNVQELFIEGALTAKNKELSHNETVRENILDYFNSYIKEIDNIQYSTLLKGVVRCNKTDNDFEDWHVCNNKEQQKLKDYFEKKHEQQRQENPYGIMGRYNPEKDKFCIVDFEQEKKSQSTKDKGDRRLTYSGKVCKGGWKITDLLHIIIYRLKIDPPEDFKAGSTLEMRKKIMANSILSDEKTGAFKKAEIEKADEDTLRRMMYWGFSKKEKGNRGINPICDAIQNWFKEHNLLEDDNQCGVQGKRKIAVQDSGEVKKDRTFRILPINPVKDNELFKTYVKEIAKNRTFCLNLKTNYRVPMDSKTWILALARSKVVASLIQNDPDLKIKMGGYTIISELCVAKNYRRGGIQQVVVKQMIENIKQTTGKTPLLVVNLKDPLANKNIALYESYGFKRHKTDENFTFLIYQA